MEPYYHEVPCRHCQGRGRVKVVDGNALRTLRLAAHESLRGFARRVGFSATHISDVERGRRSPGWNILRHYDSL